MAHFANRDEAEAYLACERSKGAAAMADDCLIAIVMCGDEEPAWESCEAELTYRAQGGSLACQRGLFAILHTMWAKERISDELFLELAEPIARLAAAQGDHRDIMRLAGALAIRAAWLKKTGAAEAAQPVEVEALTLLGTIANQTFDHRAMALAADDFNAFARDFSAAALGEARALLWCDGVLVDRKPEPEVIAAASRCSPITPDAWSRFLSQPLSRGQRLGAWLYWQKLGLLGAWWAIENATREIWHRLRWGH